MDALSETTSLQALLLREAWWRWRARHGLAPGRLRLARAGRLGLPIAGAVLAGLALAWLLPNVALLAARQPLFPLLLLAAFAARGGLTAAHALQAAADEHWLQALPLSATRRRLHVWLLGSLRACARTLPLWLTLYVAVFRVMSFAAMPAAGAALVVMFLAGACGSLWGMRSRHARLDARVMPRACSVAPLLDADGAASLRILLWHWQLRRLGHLRPDRHKLLLAVIALMLPIGTPLGAALIMLAFAWLMASAFDALTISRATLLHVLMLTQACITTPRRWLLAILPLPLLVLVGGSLCAATAVRALAWSDSWLRTALLFLLVCCGVGLSLLVMQPLRRRRRLDPWR
jgi:hypothetical protein